MKEPTLKERVEEFKDDCLLDTDRVDLNALLTAIFDEIERRADLEGIPDSNLDSTAEAIREVRAELGLERKK